MGELSASLMHILVVAELSCAQSGPYLHQTPLVIIKTHPPRNVTVVFSFFCLWLQNSWVFLKLHMSNYLFKISFKFCLSLGFLIMTPQRLLSRSAMWSRALFCHGSGGLCEINKFCVFFRLSSVSFKQASLVFGVQLRWTQVCACFIHQIPDKARRACYFPALFIKY